jgi:outer membrane protein assembly factor BamB
MLVPIVRFPAILAGTAVLLALCAIAAAQSPLGRNWPQWRGPAHDGVAAGEVLVDRFPPGGPPVLWVRELGQGYSGFAVAGGRAFTQTQSLYEQSLVCLDGDTGQTLWSYSYGWPYDGGGLYPGPRSTPTVNGEHVYCTSPQGAIFCVTADRGQLAWSVDFNQQFSGRGTDFGYSASPLVVDGLVILPVGGASASVVALDAESGRTVWKSASKPASYSTPLPIEWHDHPLVIALLQNSIACFHRQTGELWWELPLSQGYDEHATAPIYREPYLLVTGPFHSGATLYELTAEGERCRPDERWFSEKMSNDVASSVLAAETLFGFDLREAQSRLHRPSRGEFRALDFLTGEVRWSSKEPGHAQIIAADGKLVLFNDRGEVLLALASAEKYEELGRLAVFPDEICWSAPALADGRLYLRTQTRAACLYLGKGPLSPAQAPVPASNLVRRPRFDPTLLVGGEREYPATLPQASDFVRWFAWCFAALVFGIALAGACRLAVRALRKQPLRDSPFARCPPAWIAAAFWIWIMAFGTAGGAVINRLQDDYVFTWPLALWAAFQLAISRSFAVRGSPLCSWRRASSYAVGLLFVALCGLYFHLCRWLGLAIEWGFLTGFAAALPAAALAAWLSAGENRRPLAATASLLASFACYYWASVGFLWWRLS